MPLVLAPCGELELLACVLGRLRLGQTPPRVVAGLITHVEPKDASSIATSVRPPKQRKQLRVRQHELLGMHVPLGAPTEAVGVPGDVQVSATLGTEHARHDGHLCFGALVARIDPPPSTSPPRPVGLGGRHLERISRRVERPAEAQRHVRFPLVRVIKGTAELGQVAQ